MKRDGFEIELPKPDEQMIQAVDQESYTRIVVLQKYYFTLVTRDTSGWILLLQDPDGCYWVKEYPEGYRHGGGRPLLRQITLEEANDSFDIE